MRIVARFILGVVALAVVAALAAYSFLWWKPVGVNNYVNKVTLELAIDSPEILTSLGFIDNTPLDFHSGRLADYTRAQELKTLKKLRRARAGLDRYGPGGLSGQELLSWRVTAWYLDDLIRLWELSPSGYRVNQMIGAPVQLPQFLTDQHVIKNEKSVRRYLSRLEEFGRVLGEVRMRVEDDRNAGVTPPDFIIEKVLIGLRSFVEGGAAANPLVTTLPAKLDGIEGLTTDQKEAFVEEAAAIVSHAVIPGYEALIELFEDLAEVADHDAGIWRIPNGEAVYQAALASNTSTDLSADTIHDVGLAEVARIEAEMDAILVAVGYAEGTVAERVRILMNDPEQIFPNTDLGRAAMIELLEEINDAVMAKAPDFFITIPDAPLEVVRVPEYQEDSAPGGYYQPPALDGSRPGRFYINQKNTADNPKWTLPSLMFHEAAPGHHFQITRAALVENVPFLRKFLPLTAYAEGWALYAERIAALDMGMYEDDPLGDLGRLQYEMFRAVRLVVDTGMHAKRWSREEAIEYMLTQTGMTEDEVTREIERYVVLPGQATAYKTGQLAIVRMRGDAEAALGPRFDLREFHEVVLSNGALPLGILEDVVDAWVVETLAEAA